MTIGGGRPPFFYANDPGSQKGTTMTLDKARELISVQANMAGGYNLNAAKLIMAEVQREHGQHATDQLIREYDLENKFGFKPGSSF